MPHGEMDAIEVQDAVVREKRTLSPGLKLLGQGLIETTDRAGAGSHPHQCLGHISHFLRTDSSHKHLREPFSYLRFIAIVTIKHLGLEVPFSISGDLKISDGT